MRERACANRAGDQLHNHDVSAHVAGGALARVVSCGGLDTVQQSIMMVLRCSLAPYEAQHEARADLVILTMQSLACPQSSRAMSLCGAAAR